MAREKKFSTNDLFQATKKILLAYGYQGFTFSLLAEEMDLSRGALYKYYENKEELITEYMIYEMDQFLSDLKNIQNQAGFHAQFEFLLETIFKHHKIHQNLMMVQQISLSNNEKIRDNIVKLNKQHLDIFSYLQSFVSLGRKEQILKTDLPNDLVLGFILHSIAIPNNLDIPQPEWVKLVKEIITHGICKKK